MASEVEDDGPDSPRCTPEDLEKIMQMIENLKMVVGDKFTAEKAFEKFWDIVSKFQEHPHMLDGHMERILNELVHEVMNTEIDDFRTEIFKYIHAVMKVCGYKRVSRYMPHEVTNLEPIMTMLEAIDVESESWQTSYVLLVWLSILVLTPFPLSHFDPPSAGGEPVPAMMHRIELIIKKNLMSNDKFPVVAHLAANFYTRVDVKEKMLSPFLEWINSVIVDKKELTISKTAAMAAAAAILKRGDRDDLIEHAKKLLMLILEERSDVDNNSVLFRKYRVKLIQRLGLTFMKIWKINWRYVKSGGLLVQNLMLLTNPSAFDSTVTKPTDLNGEEQPSDEEQFEEDVIEFLSEVVDRLINALEDSDTVVRWSAAKGIGRLTERFTQQMGAMVLNSILDIFSDRRNHNSWHGACLALAQLASRGLLPKSRLAEVVNHVISASIFDIPKRFSSVGDNVRDAACYVFWAFARAFDVEDLKPLSNLIMTNLLQVALFDREVHCRRAASAAFQEYVGRCAPIDPNAIAIMNEADYLAVGSRTNAYLQISVEIAKIGGFTKAIIEHLIVNRLCHWDAAIRDLAAKALFLLTPFEPLYISSFLPALLKNAYSDSFTKKLGATPGMAEIIHGLYVAGSLHDYVDDLTLEKVKNIVPNYIRDGEMRGIGGEMLKGSCCKYIWKCCEAKMEIGDIAEDWICIVQDCIFSKETDVREAALNALRAYLENYHSPTLSDKIVKDYVAVLSDMGDNGDFRRACGASVFCHIPNVVYDKHLDTIIPALIKCTHISAETNLFTESRHVSVKALLYIVINTDIKNFSKGTLSEIFLCFLGAMEDYSKSKKGDIGAKVRAEAVVSLFAMLNHVLTFSVTMLEQHAVEKMVPKIMQLALEPQIRINIPAGIGFGKLIHSEPEIPYVPELANLKKIFPVDKCADEEFWKDNAHTFPYFMEVILLMEPSYMHNVLVAFIMSIGGVSESAALNVGDILFGSLEDISIEKASGIASELIKVLAISQKLEHMTSPVICFFHRMMESEVLNRVLHKQSTNFAADLLSLMVKGRRLYKDPNKVKAAVSIFSTLIAVKGQVGCKAFRMLLSYLKNTSGAIRTATAGSMFERLSLLDDDTFPGCNMQAVEKLLIEADWKDCEYGYINTISKISEEMAPALKK